MRHADQSTHLVLVGYDDQDGAERALISHWHARDHHALSLQAGCVVRRDESGQITYRTTRDLTPRTSGYYGGALGFALACLLIVPLFFGGDDELHIGPFNPAQGEGCRDVLQEALPRNSSAAIFVVHGPDLQRAVVEAELLDGKIAELELDQASAKRFLDAIDRESLHITRQ